nr:glycosyltransferase family 4 protein [Vagococcus allomyrinae]
MRKSKVELEFADKFIVASEFTKYSLVTYGVKEELINVVPYAVQPSDWEGKKKRRDNAKIKLLFVGSLTKAKGAYHFYNVIKKLPINYDVTFVGQVDKSTYLYNEMKDKVSFLGHVPKSSMESIYRENHFLVFPSLADGYGLSIVESLRVGTPVICSKNAGACNLIIEGENGFLFDYNDENQLYELLLSITEYDYFNLSKKAIESVKSLTIGKYAECINNTLINWITENQKKMR